MFESRVGPDLNPNRREFIMFKLALAIIKFMQTVLKLATI